MTRTEVALAAVASKWRDMGCLTSVFHVNCAGYLNGAEPDSSVMQYLKSKLFDLSLLLWTGVLGVLIPFLVLAGDEHLTRAASRMWSRGIVFGLRMIVGLSHREIGLQNRPPSPSLYVSNHQSAWETLTFSVLIPDVAIVLKRVLYRYPIFGWYLKHSPMIAIDRTGGATALRQMVGEARKAIENGRSVLIFPEGTRRSVHERANFHRGVVLLYRQLGVPVVPVAVNSGIFWSPEGWMKYNGEITVSYLPPILPGLADKDFVDRLHGAVMDEKDRLVARLDQDLWIAALG